MTDDHHRIRTHLRGILQRLRAVPPTVSPWRDDHPDMPPLDPPDACPRCGAELYGPCCRIEQSGEETRR